MVVDVGRYIGDFSVYAGRRMNASTVIVYEPTDPISSNLIERIDAALSAEFEIAPGIAVRCTASIGTADTRTIGYEAAELLAAADAAMYEMKRSRQSGRTP